MCIPAAITKMRTMTERTRYGERGSLLSHKVVVFVLAFLVIPDAVSASSTILASDLHPVLRWVCSLRNFELHEIGHDSFWVDASTRNDGPNFDICSNFRGGSSETDQNITDREEESSSTVGMEKSAPVDYTNSPYAFSLYQEGDGSKEDPDGIPTRYLKMQGGRREQAHKALDITLAWRKEHNIDTILARPHAKFDRCKSVFPHYFCGRDDTNHVILLQRPGLINLNMAHANDISGEDLLYHYIYEMEYLWQVLEPSANGTMTSIIDLTGLNLSVLGKRELMGVVQKFCSTMDAHFPTRSHKMLLINAPKWFGTLYKIISPILRESTKQKIAILSKGKAQDKALNELLSECPIADDKKLNDIPPSEMEEELRDFVSSSGTTFCR